MSGKKLFIVVIIACVLLLQLLDPASASARRRRARTNMTQSLVCGPQYDVICFVNFLVTSLFDILAQILAAVGTCLPCDTGIPNCAACFAASIPVPPTIPNCTLP